MTRSCYEVLGVVISADTKTIKSAYRRLAMKYHPDRNPGDATAEGKFKEAAEAYEILGDDEKRRLYDKGEIDEKGKPAQTVFEEAYQTSIREEVGTADDIRKILHRKDKTKNIRKLHQIVSDGWTSIEGGSLFHTVRYSLDLRLMAAKELGKLYCEEEETVSFGTHAREEKNASRKQALVEGFVKVARSKIAERTISQQSIVEIFYCRELDAKLKESAIDLLQPENMDAWTLANILKNEGIGTETKDRTFGKFFDREKIEFAAKETTTNREVPEIYRVKAGEILVGRLKYDGKYGELYDLKMNYECPEGIRSKAGSVIKYAVKVAANPLVEKDRYSELYTRRAHAESTWGKELAAYFDPYLEGVADKRLEKVVESIVEEIDKFDANKTRSLVFLHYPKSSIIKACKKIADECAKIGDMEKVVQVYDELKHILSGKDLEAIQKEKEQTLENAGEKALQKSTTATEAHAIFESNRYGKYRNAPESIRKKAKEKYEDLARKERLERSIEDGDVKFVSSIVEKGEVPTSYLGGIEIEPAKATQDIQKQAEIGFVMTLVHCLRRTAKMMKNRNEVSYAACDKDLPTRLRIGAGIRDFNKKLRKDDLENTANVLRESSYKTYPELLREKVGIDAIHNMISLKPKTKFSHVMVLGLPTLIQKIKISAELKALRKMAKNADTPELAKKAAKEASSFRTRLEIFFGRRDRINITLAVLDEEMKTKLHDFRKTDRLQRRQTRARLAAA